MFRKIDYGADKKFEPIPVIRKKTQPRKYNDWDVIIGKSILKEEKNCSETGTILELMKSMKRTNKSI
jgi:hypothetical protein